MENISDKISDTVKKKKASAKSADENEKEKEAQHGSGKTDEAGKDTEK
jgi:electron transport complex protein RnfD